MWHLCSWSVNSVKVVWILNTFHVKVRLRGLWFPYCASDWSVEHSRVICKRLGFGQEASFFLRPRTDVSCYFLLSLFHWCESSVTPGVHKKLLAVIWQIWHLLVLRSQAVNLVKKDPAVDKPCKIVLLTCNSEQSWFLYYNVKKNRNYSLSVLCLSQISCFLPSFQWNTLV